MNITGKDMHDRTLKKIDGVEILSLVDNSVDFLSAIDKKEVQSFRQWKWTKGYHIQEWAKAHFQQPVAEHGFSMFIRVSNEGKSNNVLLDTGGSPERIIENAEIMGLDISEVKYIVLSHGHYDHFGGLISILKTVNKINLPVIVHEDMFKSRGVVTSDGTIRKYPEFPKENLVSPAIYAKTKQPYLIADNNVLVTGEIPRIMKFEKGFAKHRAFIDGKWQPDPLIWDDRALVINVKHKGLVILSGCAHAGIINTLLYSQQITGIKKIYAVLGGFHLAGKEYKTRIDKTVEKLKQLKPSILAPSHCTGWKGAFAIAESMPQAFIWGSVGNLYRF
jgi:7,8-dihydropterin-6-yl-methyl-4-(beta-D-ribofuranosyl)aminobenzene 5'-phosphate synthase